MQKHIDFIHQYIDCHMDAFHYTFIQSHDEGYGIKKHNKAIEITYHTLNDFYKAYGMLLGSDLSEDFNIKDQRSIDKLGYMIDCARNAVPKVETLKRQMMNLSLMGYTYIGLYLEDLFEMEGEPHFGEMRGRYTKAEIHEIVDFGQVIGLKVIPYIQTLAHVNAIFKHQSYKSVLDINDILLVDEPKTYELIEKMLISVKDMFQTNEINIGMDEAWMLGLGQYLKQHGFKDRMTIMVNHLNKVMAICKKHGIKASMWADMFFHLKSGAYYSEGVTSFADIKALIPEDVELVYWDYYHTNIKDYDDKFDSLLTLSDDVGFAGGAWKWVGFAPFNDFTKRSMTPAIASCKSHNVKHFVATSWGDNGAEASIFSVLPGLIFMANGFYQHQMDASLFLKRLTGFDGDAWHLLDLPNQIYPSDVIKTVNPSKYLLYEDVLLGDPMIKLHPSYQLKYMAILKQFDQLILPQSKYSYVFKTLRDLTDILTLKSTLSIDLVNAYQKHDRHLLKRVSDTIYKVIDKIKYFNQTFKTAWYEENKIYGFEVQSYRLGGLVTRLEEVNTLIHDYLNGKIDEIHPLKVRILNLADDDDPYLGCIYYNQFIKMVTFGTF